MGKRLMRKSANITAVFIYTVCANTALAWWVEGHLCVNDAAFALLPDDMPAFFMDSRAQINDCAADPDLHKSPLLPNLTPTERPEHFLDLELLGDNPIPPTRAEYHALCAKLKISPDFAGYLPYSISEWHDRLALAFAQYRKRPDNPIIRAKIIYIAGILSHYTADSAQPLHCTLHHDGRAKPDGSSPKSGIHLRMDDLPGKLGMKAADIVQGRKCDPAANVFELTVSAIRKSNGRIDAVYKLESELPKADQQAPVNAPAAVRELCRDCMLQGAELTATAWYSAWKKSAAIELPAWYK
ncbi:MAG TPA: hypothetical protein PL033_05405 [Candidatus Brocadiia bacterium]|nr:hypothetical protein [Candidatus Brocadiia bacterium]